MLRLLAVEDDPVQARLLRHTVRQLGYEVVGTAASAAEAEAMFGEMDPDMVLLDIHLRGEVDGVALALRLLQIRPVPLIFMTSDHDRSTYERALAAGPFAFLEKPYAEAALTRALELAVAHHARQQGGALADLPDGGALVPGALYVRENNRLLKVRYDEVLWLEADDSHVHLHASMRKYTVRVSLRDLESKLPPGRFLRVRRNALVQLAAIENIDLKVGTVWVGGQEVPVGGTYRDALLARLNRVG